MKRPYSKRKKSQFGGMAGPRQKVSDTWLDPRYILIMADLPNPDIGAETHDFSFLASHALLHGMDNIVIGDSLGHLVFLPTRHRR